MASKRVIFLCSTAPDLRRGGAGEYNLQLIRGLHHFGCEVHLFCLEKVHQDGDCRAYCADIAAAPGLRSMSAPGRRLRQACCIAKGKPSLGQVGTAQIKGLLQYVRDVGPEAVWVSHMAAAGVMPSLRKTFPDMQIVFVSHNCETDVRRLYGRYGRFRDRALSRLDFPRVRDLEQQICDLSDAVTVISARDRDLYEHYFGAAKKLHVLPPSTLLSEAPDEAGKNADPRRVLHCGSFGGYRAKRLNLEWFVREVWPRVEQSVPDATMDLIGRNPPGSLLRAAKRCSRLHVHGWVEDLRPYYRRAGIYVLPTRIGGGFELKTIHAALNRCAIVGSEIPLGAAQMTDGVHARLADSGRQYAEVIGELSNGPRELEHLCASALQHVSSEFSWQKFLGSMDMVLSRSMHTVHGGDDLSGATAGGV
ncbi:MAG: glycosyltransferase family 4 protein [Phycisphaerae bacterium]